VTGNAKALRSRGDQLDASDIFVDPYLVARQTAHRHRGVNRLPLGFVLVTFQALGGVNVLV